MDFFVPKMYFIINQVYDLNKDLYIYTFYFVYCLS